MGRPLGRSPLRTREARDSASSIMLLVLRLVFFLVLFSVGWTFASKAGESDILPDFLRNNPYYMLIIFGSVGLAFMLFDVFIPQKSLTAMSGIFFGLVIGMIVSYGLSLIIDLLVESSFASVELDSRLVSVMKLTVGVICCYLAVSFILQTKDDVRFVIPYVEFSKETKGAVPFVLDTSVIIDGRIADIAETGIIDQELVLPRFVLQEIQSIADSGDKLKRNRGRRGLDVLNKLQLSDRVDIRILDVEFAAEGVSVDEMLVDLAMELGGRVVTNDYNLNKIAQLRGVMVININDLANALRPVVLPGETMQVKVIKPGEEAGQGVGYLEDGTMVVAEGGRDHIGETIQITVTSVLQTSAGRMIFGRSEGYEPPLDRRRPRVTRT